MRYFLLLLVGLSLSIFTSGLLAQTQAEMNASAGADLEKADAKLNLLYQRILAQNAGDKPFCEDLREAQRAWLKFVNFHLKTVFPLKDGEDPRVVYGSIYPLEFADIKTTLINQRIQQLESISSDEAQ